MHGTQRSRQVDRVPKLGRLHCKELGRCKLYDWSGGLGGSKACNRLALRIAVGCRDAHSKEQESDQPMHAPLGRARPDFIRWGTNRIRLARRKRERRRGPHCDLFKLGCALSENA